MFIISDSIAETVPRVGPMPEGAPGNLIFAYQWRPSWIFHYWTKDKNGNSFYLFSWDEFM